MYVIIVGGGKVGYHLAKFLIAEKNEVLLIEMDGSRVSELSAEFGEAVMEGNGSRVPILQEGGANRANVLVAVTGADEDNLVICQIAKAVFKCPRTIARVNDPFNEPLFSAMGVDATVSSTRLINSLIEEQVRANEMMIPLLTLRTGNVEIIEVELSDTSDAMGKSIKDILLPEGSRIIAILRGHEVVIPTGESQFHAGDNVVVLVKKDMEEALRKVL